MRYRIHRNTIASRDIRSLAHYLRREAGGAVARTYLAMLEYDLEVVIAHSPHTFAWFHETGEPYRAKLFKLGRTTFWIIYTVDEAQQQVEITRLWNVARNPETHGLGESTLFS
jgi:plasmid stabilization system protein ParE